MPCCHRSRCRRLSTLCGSLCFPVSCQARLFLALLVCPAARLGFLRCLGCGHCGHCGLVLSLLPQLLRYRCICRRLSMGGGFLLGLPHLLRRRRLVRLQPIFWRLHGRSFDS
jgi:hypothetical protein